MGRKAISNEQKKINSAIRNRQYIRSSLSKAKKLENDRLRQLNRYHRQKVPIDHQFGDEVGEGFGDGVGERFGDRVGEGFGDGVSEGFGDGFHNEISDRVSNGVNDEFGDGFSDGVSDRVGDGVGDGFGDAIGDGFGDRPRVGDRFGNGFGDRFDDELSIGYDEKSNRFTNKRNYQTEAEIEDNDVRRYNGNNEKTQLLVSSSIGIQLCIFCRSLFLEETIIDCIAVALTPLNESIERKKEHLVKRKRSMKEQFRTRKRHQHKPTHEQLPHLESRNIAFNQPGQKSTLYSKLIEQIQKKEGKAFLFYHWLMCF